MFKLKGAAGDERGKKNTNKNCKSCSENGNSYTVECHSVSMQADSSSGKGNRKSLKLLKLILVCCIEQQQPIYMPIFLVSAIENDFELGYLCREIILISA